AKTVTKYIYFKELNFLDRITENEVSESMYNINEQSSSSETIAHVVNNDEISGSSQNSSTPVADQDKPTWTRKRKHERVQENSAFEKKLVDLLDKNMPDISSDDLSFFNSLGPILKSFNSYKKLLFRSKVLQIAMDLSAPTSSGTTSTSNILSPEHNSNSTTTSTTNHSNDTTTQRGYQSASQYYTVMSPENDSNSSVMCATNSSYFSNQTLPVNESMSSTTTQQGYQTANQYDPHSTVNNSVQQSCEEIQHFPNIASENDNFY
ncbi:jg10166, partial [Pararge aegeria aegeria]